MTRLQRFSLVAVCGLGVLASPRAFGDPSKIQPVAITASNSYSGSSPCNVIDGDTHTAWNAGGFAPQWIQLDLGRLMPVRNIRLNTLQSPSGTNTVHAIMVGTDPAKLQTVTILDSNTYDGQWLDVSSEGFSTPYTGGGNIRYIRIYTQSSASWIGWREIEVYGGLEYFGYFCDSCWDHDSVAAVTSAGANLVWLPADAALATKLAEAKSRGVKAMVYVEDQVFSGYTLVSDWRTRWKAIRDTIVNGGYTKTVAAFYMHDEPYPGATSATMRTLASQIGTDFPGTPRAAILLVSGSTLMSCTDDPDPQKCLDMFDWVGFDCYGNWDACGDGSTTMDKLNAQLRSRLSGAQRLIAVPQANTPAYGFDETPSGQQNLITYELDRWHKHIVADSKYVAMVPFMWVDGNGNSAGTYGANRLPLVRERLYQIAYSIMPGDPNPHAFPVDTKASTSADPWFPFEAFDEDTSNMWISNWAPQWIAADLVDPKLQSGGTRVSSIVLTVRQDRFTSPTTHILWGQNALDHSWKQLKTWSGNTVDGQQLVWAGSEDLSAIEVDTNQSPAWVGWRDIQIRRAAPTTPICTP